MYRFSLRGAKIAKIAPPPLVLKGLIYLMNLYFFPVRFSEIEVRNLVYILMVNKIIVGGIKVPPSGHKCIKPSQY